MTEDYKALVERLRTDVESINGGFHVAADAIETLTRERDEAREIIALCARDYLGMRDKFVAEPILQEAFPRVVEELRETGEWLESYKDSPTGAMGELASKLITARRERDEATARAERAEAALEWYGEQARLCRLIHSEGDKGRHALSNDGGERARAALAQKGCCPAPGEDGRGNEAQEG